jgi:hypothetical protein
MWVHTCTHHLATSPHVVTCACRRRQPSADACAGARLCSSRHTVLPSLQHPCKPIVSHHTSVTDSRPVGVAVPLLERPSVTPPSDARDTATKQRNFWAVCARLLPYRPLFVASKVILSHHVDKPATPRTQTAAEQQTRAVFERLQDESAGRCGLLPANQRLLGLRYARTIHTHGRTGEFPACGRTGNSAAPPSRRNEAADNGACISEAMKARHLCVTARRDQRLAAPPLIHTAISPLSVCCDGTTHPSPSATQGGRASSGGRSRHVHHHGSGQRHNAAPGCTPARRHGCSSAVAAGAPPAAGAHGSSGRGSECSHVRP